MRCHVIYIIGSDELLCIFDFQNGGRLPSWIFIFSKFFWKVQICTYLYVVMQNLVKIGRCTAELLHIFDFQNGRRLPSWIWYDVIADHPRLVFDGPNILLKLDVDRINILRYIAIFIFGPFGFKFHIHAHFWWVLVIWRGSPWNWVQGSKTRVLGLPDGRKKIKINLAIYTQYCRVTDRHIAIAKTALCHALRG